MTVQKIGLSIVIASMLLTGCGGMVTSRDVASSLAETTKECSDLKMYQEIWDKSVADLRETYMDEYFESDLWVSYEEGFWSGIWMNHKYCKICNANGDVPEKYVLTTQEEE